MNVHLTPLSPKAKNLLANSLHGNPICSLEQLRDGEIFVTSADRSFCTWVKTEGDPDWAFTFTREPAASTLNGRNQHHPPDPPDAKLHRLELTDTEVRLLIRVINYANGSGGIGLTAGSLIQGRLLTLRGRMERSKPT